MELFAKRDGHLLLKGIAVERGRFQHKPDGDQGVERAPGRPRAERRGPVPHAFGAASDVLYPHRGYNVSVCGNVRHDDVDRVRLAHVVATARDVAAEALAGRGQRVQAARRGLDLGRRGRAAEVAELAVGLEPKVAVVRNEGKLGEHRREGGER